jgi:hypothetical protein
LLESLQRHENVTVGGLLPFATLEPDVVLDLTAHGLLGVTRQLAEFRDEDVAKHHGG